MAYAEFTTCPAWTRAVWTDGKLSNRDAGTLWGGDYEPPAIGSHGVVTINGCGPAVVTGYFVEDGWLGLKTRLLAPPAWFVKQNKGDPNGHSFGPEFLPLDWSAALAYSEKLTAEHIAASDALQALPGVGSGTSGLTPDEVKISDDYKRAKARYDGAHDRLRRFNSWFTVFHKRELAAHRAARRAR